MLSKFPFAGQKPISWSQFSKNAEWCPAELIFHSIESFGWQDFYRQQLILSCLQILWVTFLNEIESCWLAPGQAPESSGTWKSSRHVNICIGRHDLPYSWKLSRVQIFAHFRFEAQFAQNCAKISTGFLKFFASVWKFIRAKISYFLADEVGENLSARKFIRIR